MRNTTTHFIFCFSAFLIYAPSAWSQYVVDQDLGQIATGASVSITGDTSASGGPVRNAAGFHFLVTNLAGNWGHERVYQFEATEPLLLELESVAETGSPDFILLNSLDAFDVPSAGKAAASGGRAVALLDGPIGSSENLRGVRPGTYYLSIENFDGFDLVTGPVPQGDATFTTLLKTSVPSAFDLREIQGMIASPGGAVSFNTFGSGMDTVIALYRDNDGILVASNDDSEFGLESEILLEDGLEAGLYHLAVGGAGTQFGDNYAVTPGATGGFFQLTHSNGLFTPPSTLLGALDLNFAATSVQYYTFAVEEPPAATDLGEIATTEDPVSLSLLNSSTLGDSEIAVYDDQGFLLATNDDFDDGVFLSRLDFPALPAGTFYVAVSGWNYFFLNGFLTPALMGGTTVGNFTLDYPGGSQSGFADTGVISWFRFDVVVPTVDLTSFSLNQTTSEILLNWEAEMGKTYAIYAGSSLDDFTPISGQSNLTSGAATLSVDLENDSRQFFQVREE